MGNSLTFTDLLKQKTWTKYEDYIKEAHIEIKSEVKKHIQEEEKFIKAIKNSDEFNELETKDVSGNLKEAEKLLLNGNVIGIDGTRSTFRLLSGTRTQIGVVAVNYLNDKIKHSFLISEASFFAEKDNIMDNLHERTSNESEITDMAIRGLMLYREREMGLLPEFKDKFVMFHGPLLPFELINGLGRFRALHTTVEQLKQIIDEKRFFSIISASSRRFYDYLYFGRAINPFEFLTSSKHTLKDHIYGNPDFMNKSKWRDDEYQYIEKFLIDYAENIYIGVIRVGDKPYVFHAHKENFEMAAAIIARDSMFQREKGFPLLIDYADNLCSQYFPTSDFIRLMEWELAINNKYFSSIPEKSMRM